MGGWDATGFRVYKGSTIVTESRTQLVLFVWVTKTRTVTTERAEWLGLTQAGAAAKAATATWTITSREVMGPSAQWRVVEEKITYGAWS